MSAPWQILLPPEIDPAGPSSIDDFADCTGMDAYDSVDDALGDIAQYDAVIVRVAELDREVIERAESLQVIAKHGSGLDNVDIEAASEHDIVVCNTPGVNARSVAEHAIALQFGVRRNLAAADRHVRAGGWDRSAFVGYELQDSTLGLMGFGSIAHETAAIAQGIGLDVIIYDPNHPADRIPEGIGRVDELIDLFRESDAVSLHVPLVDGTYHAVSTAQFEALGEDGVLINTSRGGVVDKDALLAALDNDVIAGAGIDNFEEEPPGADHPIYEHSEVLMTPHIAGVTYDALERMSRGAAANVRTVYEGGLPASTVNREALEGEASQ
ncbi:hydroxyacid dehydrogenase [Halohasta litorea]|uniref:Hydroxyacid dehydrogenase n=1 Tax=Halohasta litorea TaxID=869891 RepID=A0ABD6DCN9_9EURY|nr:hydroxyacid dehydrogenase [Halohasta litorea]